MHQAQGEQLTYACLFSHSEGVLAAHFRVDRHVRTCHD